MPEPNPQPANARSPQAQGARAKLRADLADSLTPKIVEVRQRRRQIDEVWLRNHAAWKAMRVRWFYESEFFRHYIPAGRRAIERVVTRVTQMLYPSSEFFEVYPGDEISLASGKQADSIRAYTLYLIEQRIQFRKLIAQWVRSLTLFDGAVAKNEIKVVDIPMVTYGAVSGPIRQIWPSSRVVDRFSFYVWPETAASYDETVMVFEDVLMPWSEYQLAVTRGVADAVNRRDLGPPEWPYHLKQRLATAGLVEPGVGTAMAQTDGYGQKGPPVQGRAMPVEEFLAITEVWWKSSEGRWYQAWVCWNTKTPTIVRLHPSAYPEPPYRWALARPLPNEHYTSGLMADLEPLQIWLNDQVNQAEESRVITALPPILINTILAGRTDSYKFGPRQKWLVDDVQTAIKMMEIPDTSATSQRAMQYTMSLIDNMAGNPLTQGQPTRNLPRAGIAVNNMMQLAMAEISDLAQILETELLSPTLADLHRLTLAFVPRSQVMQIPGAANYPARTITVDELYGNWSFRWVGSQMSQNQQTKAQQMIVTLQALARLAPLAVQQGWYLNIGLLIKRIWRDALGERGIEQIIVPLDEAQKVNPAGAALAMAQAQQPFMQPPGGMPGGMVGGGRAMPAQGPGDVMNQQARQMTEPNLGQMLAGLSQGG